MDRFMKEAIVQAQLGIRSNDGGPFGCVIVKDGVMVGKGHNEVLRQKDPTCHGEIMAIRSACRSLGTYDLTGCQLYSTAQPCPMCAGAILWANISQVFYGCDITDTESIGFRDKQFYEQPDTPGTQICREQCLEVFEEYKALGNKKEY